MPFPASSSLKTHLRTRVLLGFAKLPVHESRDGDGSALHPLLQPFSLVQASSMGRMSKNGTHPSESWRLSSQVLDFPHLQGHQPSCSLHPSSSIHVDPSCHPCRLGPACQGDSALLCFWVQSRDSPSIHTGDLQHVYTCSFIR